MTRRGIEYDLTITPYRVQIRQYCFMFSSVNNRNKFFQKYLLHRDKFNMSMQDRYNLDITVNLLADIVCYMDVEKRGFLIEMDGVKICQKNLNLDGLNVMKQNCKTQ